MFYVWRDLVLEREVTCTQSKSFTVSGLAPEPRSEIRLSKILH